MDKHSVIGLILIGAILVGSYFFTRPSAEERAEMQRVNDSIRQANHMADSLKAIELEEAKRMNEEAELSNVEAELRDSLEQLQNARKYGVFTDAVSAESRFVTIENNNMIVTFNTRGAKVHSVQLKDYKKFGGEPLVMYDGDNAFDFGFNLSLDSRPIQTTNMAFDVVDGIDNVVVSGDGESSIRFRLAAGDADKYIEYVYTLKSDEYLLDFDVNFNNMNEMLPRNVNYMELNWSAKLNGLERGRSWEASNSTVHYREMGEKASLEKLNERKESTSEETAIPVNWIAFKQQFFSGILVCDEGFEESSFAANTPATGDYIKEMDANMTVAYLHEANKTYKMHWYFGPNKFSSLKSYDKDFEAIVPLGKSIIRWINKLAIIPMFNLLGNLTTNYGLIILIMTIVIKLALFPLTYKSYMSSAKMKVLKPQIDIISEKFPKGKEAEKQQAIMGLYKQAGANPMGGCLPLLLQMPILIAMFRFFPSSIELRQQSFLWATDLSSYDSILTLPFDIPIYGNHVSLFTLLMAVSMVISTKLNSSAQPTGPNASTMKMMMWFMPIMLLFMFNSYASGLSYYYFLANLITIGQTWAIRRFFVDEKAVLAKLEANKKKPKKKSKFQQRLEEAAKQKGYNPPKR